MSETTDIIIRIENHKITFNETYSIPFHFTNLPKDIKFRTRTPIYWLVEILDKNAETGTLTVRIRDYKADPVEKFLAQHPRHSISALQFIGEYNWPVIQSQLISYSSNSFPEQVRHRNERIEQLAPYNKTRINSFGEPPPVPQRIEEFLIDFDDALFITGGISFSKHIKAFNQRFDFMIPNEHLLPDFENIKGWFVKKLKKKRFRVKANFAWTDSRYEHHNIQSEEIASIDKEFVEKIRLERTIAISERPRRQTEKTLFTKEEIFSVMSEDGLEENIFNQSEREIMNLLVEKHNPRNRPQLEYLSTHKQSTEHPIRYTLHPNFGFLFTIPKDHNCFLVWELLNSHATYVWKIAIDDSKFIECVRQAEKEINMIKASNRESYKKKHLDEMNDKFSFYVINHKKSGGAESNNFDHWKNKISELI